MAAASRYGRFTGLVTGSFPAFARELGIRAGAEWVHPEDLVSLPERRDARAEPIDFSFDDDAEHASASDPESEDQTGRDAEHGLDIAET